MAVTGRYVGVILIIILNRLKLVHLNLLFTVPRIVVLAHIIWCTPEHLRSAQAPSNDAHIYIPVVSRTTADTIYYTSSHVSG